MLKVFSRRVLFAGCASVALIGQATAADPIIPLDPVLPPAPDEARAALGGHFSVGFGWIGITANEYVWAANSAGGVVPPLDWMLSRLIWETRAPVVSFDLGFRVNRFTFDADVAVAFSGNSHMEDYDWLAPFALLNGPNDWTHQSIHPDTNLAHYVSAVLALGYDVVAKDYVTVNLNFGFRYTDVKWSANNGSFTYSVAGFRDTVGVFADVPVIDYRQQWPVAFVGLDVEATKGPWTFGAVVQGGVTVGAHTTDNHWLRDLLITDVLYRSPVLHLGARVERELSHGVSIFVEGAFDKIYAARADATYLDTILLTGITFLGVGGADFRSLSVSIGAHLAF